MNQPLPTTRPPARQRRGIILVFVVVLLVLLAIMGTAYLATTRADLVTLRGRGAGLNNTKPLLNNRATLDSTFEAVGTRLKKVIGVDDVQSQVDHPAVDFWMSSLLPARQTATSNVRWPWISAPQINIATDPTTLFNAEAIGDPRIPATLTAFLPATPDLHRKDIEIGAIDLKATPRVERARKYPALKFDNSNAFIAGDADGDGIADSFLMPMIINPTATGVNRFVDDLNGVIYYYSYRVVDNSAQINLGTALSKTNDFPINILGTAASDTDDPGETRELIANVKEATGAMSVSNPNYGFFRSNVGLIEMLRESVSMYTGQTTPNTPPEKELRRLIDLRYPGLREQARTTAPDYSWMMSKYTKTPPGANPPSHVESVLYDAGTLTAAGDDEANKGTTSAKVLFRSFGDMAEQLVLKHPTTPESFYLGMNGGNVEMGPLASPPGAENIPSLHDKGGALLNSQLGASSVENALWLSLRNPTPNYVRRTDSIWNWFPPDQVQLWYEWTKNLEGLNLTPSNDGTYGNAAFFRFDPTANPFRAQPQGPFTTSASLPSDSIAGMTALNLQRSIRSIVTTRSGVSAAAPIRATPPPVGMPVYPAGNTVDLDAAPYGEYPGSKVSAATGTKRQLWRAYWSAMTSGSGAAWVAEKNGTSSFNSVTRYTNTTDPGSDVDSIGSRNMALIRSAIAAVNTIDLRDSDSDITELDVPLENEPNDPSTTKMVARVFGTEKRPYITEVTYAYSSGGYPTAAYTPGHYLAIEIYNPHDVPLDVANYYVALASRTGSTLADGTITINPAVPAVSVADAIAAAAIPGSTTVIPPGGLIILQVGIAPVPITAPTANTSPVVGIGTLDVSYLTTIGAGGSELVLARRRRADNEVTTDPYPSPSLGELVDGPNAATKAAAVSRMVPIETIDMRYVVLTPDPVTLFLPVQYEYRRTAVDMASATAAANRWRCVYGGQFFEVPLALPSTPDEANPSARPLFYPAWRKYEHNKTPGADGTFDEGLNSIGVHDNVTIDGVNAINTPIQAPPIQIQNFDVDTGATGQHPVNVFPFGSPFARDVDVLKVPFIGAYKIYRQDAGVGTPTVFTDDAFSLLEQNALPMDAFLAEPAPGTAVANNALGRFKGGTPSTTPWAEYLFDHISARQAPMHDFYPDVPKVQLLDRNGVDTTLADDDTTDFSIVTTSKLAYVGNDGLVKGTAADAPNTNVGVVRYSVGGEDAKREGLLSEDVKSVSEANAIIQGKININTAPAVVLRMLPWVVDVTTGISGDAQLVDTNAIVDAIVKERDVTSPNQPFKSLTGLLQRTELEEIRNLGKPQPTSKIELLYAGDLGGKTNQPTVDLFSDLYNLNRVSNLITTRSDVYTVYYTVQAWTYRPTGTAGWNQQQDTRLVGERRGAFVLDRSHALPGGSVKDVQTIQIANE